MDKLMCVPNWGVQLCTKWMVEGECAMELEQHSNAMKIRTAGSSVVSMPSNIIC